MEIKCQLDATEVFIAELIACSTCFGRFAGCCSILQTGHTTLSSTPDQQFENHNTNYHRQQPLYNTLELLMMGVVVPETCWASNEICNKKKPLLHVVGILFPHTNDDARSKSHQIYEVLSLQNDNIMMEFNVKFKRIPWSSIFIPDTAHYTHCNKEM